LPETNMCSYSQVMELSHDHNIEHLRRSFAMLPAGANAINREDAMELLARLRDVTSRLRRAEVALETVLVNELRTPD